MITRPSERARWSQCSGYPAFRALLDEQGTLPPEKPAEAAWRGTVGHSIVEELLRPVAALSAAERLAWTRDYSTTLRAVVAYEGRVYDCPDAEEVSCTVDLELIEAVVTCIDAVARALEEADEGAGMLVETQVTLFGVSGTADVIIWSPYHRYLWVIDHKFGKGQRVAVRGNPQLQFYGATAAGIFAAERVILGIVQPAHGGASWTRHDISEVMEWQNQIELELRACAGRERRLAAGSWCRWCDCASVCPALEQAAEDAVTYASLPAERWPVSLQAAGVRLRQYEDVLMPYFAALRQALHAALKSGEVESDEVGWKMVEKRATRKWVDEMSVKAWLVSHGISIAEMSKHTLFSPAQIETAIKKHGLPLPQSELDALVERVSSGTTLTRLDSPRKTVTAQQQVALGPLPASALTPAA